MKQAVAISGALLALATLACAVNVPQLKTGPTETVTINEPAPEGAAEVTIEMGAGELALSGGAEGLASGTIDYNVAEWKPTVTREGDQLKISQGNSENNVGVPDKDVVNKWAIQLGSAPMALTLNAGAYQGQLDLSGIPLQKLDIHDGASDTELRFDSLNPEVMSELTYETGASNTRLLGLANANFETLTFTGGAGDYTLDFTGDLQRDTSATIKNGLGNLNVIVSTGTNVTINVNGGVTNVNTKGQWSVANNVYTLTGSGPTLTINIEMGLGNLTLENK